MIAILGVFAVLIMRLTRSVGEVRSTDLLGRLGIVGSMLYCSTLGMAWAGTFIGASEASSPAVRKNVEIGYSQKDLSKVDYNSKLLVICFHSTKYLIDTYILLQRRWEKARVPQSKPMNP